jgi:hypothetical protein
MKYNRLFFAFAIAISLVFLAGDPLGAQEKSDAKRDVKPRVAQPKAKARKSSARDRWTAAENNTWRWYRRETRIDKEWKLTGITTPVHKQTGERYTETKGYLDESVVPVDVRRRGHGDDRGQGDDNRVATEENNEAGQADAGRRERGGRPPSKWLRSLSTNELREWLKTIDVPEAGVEGTTYYEHLTRDHSFDPEKIEGLTEEEQAKLHAAAHHGY